VTVCGERFGVPLRVDKDKRVVVDLLISRLHLHRRDPRVLPNLRIHDKALKDVLLARNGKGLPKINIDGSVDQAIVGEHWDRKRSLRIAHGHVVCHPLGEQRLLFVGKSHIVFPRPGRGTLFCVVSKPGGHNSRLDGGQR
jgi:hypothetical protein